MVNMLEDLEVIERLMLQRRKNAQQAIWIMFTLGVLVGMGIVAVLF